MILSVYSVHEAPPPRSLVTNCREEYDEGNIRKQKMYQFRSKTLTWKSNNYTAFRTTEDKYTLYVQPLTFPSRMVSKMAAWILSACWVNERWCNIMTALRRSAVGLALSCPAMSGAVPWTWQEGGGIQTSWIIQWQWIEVSVVLQHTYLLLIVKLNAQL